MNIDWNLQFGSSDSSYTAAPYSNMNEITAYTVPSKDSSNLYVCGYKLKDATSNTPTKAIASMFKMDDAGEVKYMYLFGSRTSTTSYDACRAINYDK